MTNIPIEKYEGIEFKDLVYNKKQKALFHKNKEMPWRINKSKIKNKDGGYKEYNYEACTNSRRERIKTQDI
jgi:hypothetical protein